VRSSAQAASATVAVIPAPAPSAVDPARLPYGVADVIKLSRAQINEEVIVTYIQNSGTAYNLGANEVVYLREQGVSDRVISTMLDQRKRMAESMAQAPAPVPYQQPAMTAPAVPTYAEPAPVYTPSSSVYVMPYPTTYQYYDYYRPYYPYYYSSWCSPYYGGYSYGGYYGPSLSFNFGFGGRGYHNYGGFGHSGIYARSGGFGGFSHGGSFGHSGGFSRSGSFGHSGGFGQGGHSGGHRR